MNYLTVIYICAFYFIYNNTLIFTGALVDFCSNAETSSKQTNLLSSQDKVTEIKPATNIPPASIESCFNLNDENSPFRLFEADPELKESWSKLIKSCNENGIKDLLLLLLLTFA